MYSVFVIFQLQCDSVRRGGESAGITETQSGAMMPDEEARCPVELRKTPGGDVPKRFRRA